MSTFAEWKEEATKDWADARVCFDRDLLSQLEAAQKDLEERLMAPELQLPSKEKGMLEGDERVRELRERIRGLREEIQAKTRRLVFTGMGKRKWRKLLAEHPPTKQQAEEFGRMLDHNPETFPAVAISVSCSEPGLTLDEAQWILDEMPEGVVNRVWAACLRANVKGADDPFEAASDGARAGAKK